MMGILPGKPGQKVVHWKIFEAGRSQLASHPFAECGFAAYLLALAGGSQPGSPTSSFVRPEPLVRHLFTPELNKQQQKVSEIKCTNSGSS